MILLGAVIPALGQRTGKALRTVDAVGDSGPVITARIVATYPLIKTAGDQTMSPLTVAPTSVYSNVTTFGGTGVLNGGAAIHPAAPANTITRLLADDLTLFNAVGHPPYNITSYKFAVINSNAVAVAPRMRTRFWNNDGAGGGPGTLITLISFTLATGNTFAPNSVTILDTGDLTAGGLQFAVNSRNIWAGVAFDNNGGTSGDTVATLNNVGLGVYNPVDRGSSADISFLTTTNGAFGASNPPGSQQNIAGLPDTFGWELLESTVPTAGGVAVNGRVVTGEGRGITGARITLTDPAGQSTTVSTDRLGRFSFGDVTSGRSYVISASNRRYVFDPASQVVFITDNVGDINFTAAPIN